MAYEKETYNLIDKYKKREADLVDKHNRLKEVCDIFGLEYCVKVDKKAKDDFIVSYKSGDCDIKLYQLYIFILEDSYMFDCLQIVKLLKKKIKQMKGLIFVLGGDFE